MPKKVVHIVWEDTFYPAECSWRSKKQATKLFSNQCLIDSVGWIIKETSKYIILTSRRSSFSGIGHLDRIPVSAIRKKEYLD
jgi:hypothetical protein